MSNDKAQGMTGTMAPMAKSEQQPLLVLVTESLDRANDQLSNEARSLESLCDRLFGAVPSEAPESGLHETNSIHDDITNKLTQLHEHIKEVEHARARLNQLA